MSNANLLIVGEDMRSVEPTGQHVVGKTDTNTDVKEWKEDRDEWNLLGEVVIPKEQEPVPKDREGCKNQNLPAKPSLHDLDIRTVIEELYFFRETDIYWRPFHPLFSYVRKPPIDVRTKPETEATLLELQAQFPL